MISVAREVAVDIMDLAVIMDLSEVWYLSQTKTRSLQSQIQNHFISCFFWGVLNGKEQIQLLRIHLEIEVLAFVRYFRNCYEF